MTPKILFVLGRHGQTSGNKDNLYRSWSNEPFAQLDQQGRDDARELGIFLQGTGIKFPIIITDDLDRTGETAEIVASILGIKPENIIRDKRMRPLNMGDWTGKNKDEYRLDAYMKDKSKMIPGGESLNMLNKRQSSIFGDIMEMIAKTKITPLALGHGTNSGYLYSHFNAKNSEKVGYEGVVRPGGASAFTKDGITPIFKKREGSPQLYQDGTEVSGFVTVETNRPPRECWNCRWARQFPTGLECANPLVQIDPQLQDRKQDNGNIAVGERDCCNSFQNKIGT